MAKGRTEENHVSKTKARQNEKIIQNMMTLGLAELVGTAILLFMGCMGCISAGHLPIHVAALTFGLTIMLIIQTFGHISGAHLNPVVTISSVLLGNLKPSFAVIYVVGQFAGAFIGFGMLKILLPPELTAREVFNAETNRTERLPVGLCTTTVDPRVSTMQALALETIITTILILVCCAVWDKRNAMNSDSVSLRFGLIIMAIASVAGPYTGASMNPPRSFAPAVFNNDWDYHWIYWVGPILGSFVGTLFYRAVFEAQKEEDCETIYLEETPLNEKCEKTHV